METPKNSDTETFGVYDSFGREYVAGQAEFDKGASLPVREKFIEILRPLIAGAMVADVGCGAGADLVYYKALGAKAVIGIEPSHTMRHLAQERIATDDTIISIQSGTLENTGLDEASCDIVVSRYSLHILTNLQPAFVELARILKPEGLLVIAVSHPDFDRYIAKKRGLTIGNRVDVKLFGGTVTLNNGTHTMEEYVGDTVKNYFNPLQTESFRLNQNNSELNTDLVITYQKM